MYREPRCVLRLLSYCGLPNFLKQKQHRFAHALWMHGLNFLLTFGPLFLLLRLWMGPPGGWLLASCVLVAGSLVYGLMMASTQPRAE